MLEIYLARAYETLLRLYPQHHQTLFGQEMLAVFKEAAAEHRKCGWFAFTTFALREMTGLFIGSTVERLSSLLNSDHYVAHERSPQHGNSPPYELLEAQERVAFVLRRMEYAIAHHQFEKARFYSNEEFKVREKLRLLKEQYEIEEGR